MLLVFCTYFSLHCTIYFCTWVVGSVTALPPVKSRQSLMHWPTPSRPSHSFILRPIEEELLGSILALACSLVARHAIFGKGHWALGR